MEEEEQDQEVPEAPSPVEEDEVVEEADNEEEVGENIGLVLTLYVSGACEHSGGGDRQCSDGFAEQGCSQPSGEPKPI